MVRLRDIGAKALAAAIAAALLAAAPAFGAAAPFKGLALWPDEARNNPELSKAISLEFAYCLPCDVEKDWKALEKTLDDIASRGHQAIVRFRYAYPGEKTRGIRGATAVPAAVRKRRDYHETYSANPNGDGPTWYPDWSCAALRKWTLDFYRRFAEKYDADPRIAFVEVGFGHWAEYHVEGTKCRLGVNFPSMDFQAAFAKTLDEAFKETPWLVSIDAAETERSPLAASELSKLGFGLFDDSFMHKGHDTASGDGYNERCFKDFGVDRWKRAPVGGEISYFSDKDQRNFLSPKGIYGVTWEQAARKYHVTFMVANDAVGGRFATPARFKSAADACGYGFRVARREWSETKGLSVTISNDGVAPAYHSVFPEVGGVRSSESLKLLAPGKSRTFAFPNAGQHDAVRLVSDKLPNGATVPLE